MTSRSATCCCGRRYNKHLTTATTMYREMDMRFWLDQAVVSVDGL